MGLLDGVFSPILTWLCTIPGRGVFSFFLVTNSDVAVYYSSQGRFFLLLRHILKNGHNWSNELISGPDFLKNDDILSDFIKLDLFGSTLVSAS